MSAKPATADAGGPDQRLCLVADVTDAGAFGGTEGAAALAAALSAGDVAAVILRTGPAPSDALIDRLGGMVADIQAAGAAALVDGPDGLAGAIAADGVHIEADPPRLARLLAAREGDAIIGGGGFRSRHDALVAAEAGTDYVSFGRLDLADDFSEPHHRALEEAAWWAETIETPALLFGGNALDALSEVIATGVEFVAYGSAVAKHPDGPGAAVGAIEAALQSAAAAA